jgi:outer membrane protein
MTTTMKSTALLRCGVLALLLVCAFGATAQQAARIGYVNMKRVIDNAPQTQRGRQKLEQEFESRYNEINEMEKRLEDLQNKLLRTAEMVTDDERADLELLIRTFTRDLRRSRDEYTEDFTIRFSEQQNLLIQRVDDAVKALAEQENLDLVLPDTSVVFASDRVDITDQVLQRLVDEFEAEGTQ